MPESDVDRLAAAEQVRQGLAIENELFRPQARAFEPSAEIVTRRGAELPLAERDCPNGHRRALVRPALLRAAAQWLRRFCAAQSTGCISNWDRSSSLPRNSTGKGIAPSCRFAPAVRIVAAAASSAVSSTT